GGSGCLPGIYGLEIDSGVQFLLHLPQRGRNLVQGLKESAEHVRLGGVEGNTRCAAHEQRQGGSMKRTRSLAFWILAVGIALMLPVQAYAGAPGFDKKEIRIAQWGPQTGPAAPWGSVA